MHVKDGYKLSELGEIPIEWEVVDFGSLCVTRSGKYQPTLAEVKKYIALEHIDQGSGRILGYGRSNDTTSIKTEFHKNDVLFGKLRPYLKKYWLAQFDGVCSTEILAFKTNEKALSSIILYFVEQDSFIEMATGKSYGTKMPRASWEDIKAIQVPLIPLPEQQKIADILSTVDEHISETESLIEKTKVLKQGMMQHLLNKGIGHTEFKDTEIGKIPVEWEVVPLIEVCSLRGGSGFSEKYQGHKSGKYPFYKVSDMNSIGNEKFLFESNNYINDAVLSQISATPFPANSIVFAKVGAALLLNRRRITSCSSCIDNNMMGAIANEKTKVDYLYYFLLTIDFRTFVQDGAVPSINQSQVGNILVSLPSVAEQQQIALILISIDEQIDAHQTKLTALTKLKSALMQQILTGKTRVKI